MHVSRRFHDGRTGAYGPVLPPEMLFQEDELGSDLEIELEMDPARPDELFDARATLAEGWATIQQVVDPYHLRDAAVPQLPALNRAGLRPERQPPARFVDNDWEAFSNVFSSTLAMRRQGEFIPTPRDFTRVFPALDPGTDFATLRVDPLERQHATAASFGGPTADQAAGHSPAGVLELGALGGGTLRSRSKGRCGGDASCLPPAADWGPAASVSAASTEAPTPSRGSPAGPWCPQRSEAAGETRQAANGHHRPRVRGDASLNPFPFHPPHRSPRPRSTPSEVVSSTTSLAGWTFFPTTSGSSRSWDRDCS